MNRILRAAALVVTDRRWAAILSAIALGFGLFVGVAIGPGAAGTLATGAPQIVEIPSSGAGVSKETAAGGGSGASAPIAATGGGGGEASPPETAFPSSVPLGSETSEPPPVEPTPAQPEKEPTGAPDEEAEEEGQSLTGVVVHSNPAAGSYALAASGGELVSVHTGRIRVPGTKLSVPVSQLANGTFAEEEKPQWDGKAARASFHGTVTFVDPDPATPAYTVSGRGASVLVRVAPDPTGATPTLPMLGSLATVDVRIAKPVPTAPEAAPAPEAPPVACGPGVALPPPPAPVKPPAATLWQSKVKVGAEPAIYAELAAIVTGVCPDGHAVLLSADDSREGGSDLLLAVPPKIDAAKLEIGDSVLATAEIGEGGTLTLAGLASDEQAKGADDARAAQGDLKS